jgi:hypothetical protein
MRQMYLRSTLTFCICCILSAEAAPGQSKFAPIFEKLQRTGDRSAFRSEIMLVNRQGFDFRVEVPALLHVLSSSTDVVAQEEAGARLCHIAFDHPLAYSTPIEREIFQPAVELFESHLDEALKDENSLWRLPILVLTTYLGFPPNPRTVALMYRMVDDKDSGAQGFALLGLARLRPLSAEAKQVLFSRLTSGHDKNVSGRKVLEILGTYAIDDPDVLRIFLKSAESQDVREQAKATEVLSRLTPIPAPAVEVFRRLEKRNDLDEEVAANVRAAIDRLENKARR